MKKTIEEVAEEYANNYFVMQDNHYNGLRQGFLAGAKYQVKRMYTEEDLRQAYNYGMFAVTSGRKF